MNSFPKPTIASLPTTGLLHLGVKGGFSLGQGLFSSIIEGGILLSANGGGRRKEVVCLQGLEQELLPGAGGF